MSILEKSFRLLDFNIYDEVIEKDTSSGSESGQVREDLKRFTMQMFGINEKGESFCLFVRDYNPFFYIKVADDWNVEKKDEFLNHIKTKIGKYYEKSISECKIIERKKLYGFDGGKKYKFILIKFNNTIAMNKVKNLFYETNKSGRRLKDNGYVYNNTNTYLYEANIPPLLRYFHIKEISPSGWVSIPLNKTDKYEDKKTTCKYEYEINNKHIIPLNNKETRVPYKICSFDIEASSSHGEFPFPGKRYKKLSTNIIEYYENTESKEITRGELSKIIKTAFGYDDVNNIDLVYPKQKVSLARLNKFLEVLYKTHIRDLCEKTSDVNTIESMFEKMNRQDEDDDYDEVNKTNRKINTNVNIIDLINDTSIKREDKIDKITTSLRGCGLPELEGDKVTFIGSTFLKYGEEKP